MVDKVRVHMLANCDTNDTIRNVTLEPNFRNEGVEGILNHTFYKGQNEFAEPCDLGQRLPSVSCGDIIEHPPGTYHLVKSMGFMTLNPYQFTSYKEYMSREERQNILHWVNLNN